MASGIIQDILSKGKTINTELTAKIKTLNDSNSTFNNKLTQKLNDIIAAISAFKSTNLQGLTETKNKLATVTTELEKTKASLNDTQNELARVKGDLENIQTQLASANATKNNLEEQIRQLNDKIAQSERQYNEQINAIKDEMTKKSEQEKQELQRQYNETITTLNNEKATLQKGIEDAQRAQKEATDNLSALQQEQNGLIQNLSTINEFLSQQLNLISQINTTKPEINDYTDLLDAIQTGLSGVIGEINQAVATNSSTPLYDKFMRLSDAEKDEIYRTIGQDYANTIIRNISEATPISKQNIQNILARRYNGNLLRGGNSRTGKRIRKTMKKRHRRTRKKMRGGYIYSASKQLDKASSVISSSSSSKSKSKSKSQIKDKTRRKYMK